MVVYLGRQGHLVNRKRVQRLMRAMGLAGMAPGPNTSGKHPQHKVYPYLLRGVEVERPNQVWSADVTYIRLARGFVYLVAVIDWYSRRVLSWRISNSMDASFCVDCLEDALRVHGKPEVFNSDQGSQFTSNAFTGVLKREGIAISMDGRGRALGRVEMWRGSSRQRISGSTPFVWWCLTSVTVTPFPHPAHRTGRADFPHPALFQNIKPSHSNGRRLPARGVSIPDAHRGTGRSTGDTPFPSCRACASTRFADAARRSCRSSGRSASRDLG